MRFQKPLYFNFLTDKLFTLFFNIFNRMFVIIPLALASLLSLSFWFTIPHKVNGLIIVTGISFSILILMFIARKISDIVANHNKSKVLTFFFIFTVAFAVRLLLIVVFKEDIKPFSDFYKIWCLSQGTGEEYFNYYTLFYTYLNFSVFLKKLTSVFGSSYIVLIYFNAVISSLTAALSYVIADIIYKDTQTSILAGFLMALLPSNIIYNTVGTPEFIVIIMNMLAILAMVKFIDTGKFIFAFAILAGICLGIGNSFKTFGIIIIIAFTMTIFAQWIFNKSNAKIRRRQLFSILLTVSIVFLCNNYICNFITAETENNYNCSLDTSASLPHFLLIGLNTQGEGQISIGNLSREYYKRYLSNGMDVEEAKQYAYSILKADWQQNPDKISQLFTKKFIHAWKDDTRPHIYLVNNIGISSDTLTESALAYIIHNGLASAMQFVYFITMTLSAAGAAVYAYKSSKRRCINFKVELISLIIFGYFCLIMLSEAQSRYKCLVMPLICIWAAYGAKNIYKYIKEKINK